MNRKIMLAKLHIAKKDMALTDDVYRALLYRVTGKHSAAAMSAGEIGRVLSDMKAKGWKPSPPKKAGKKPVVNPDCQRLLAKVEALLAEERRPWAYAEAIARHMYGVDKLEWCTPEMLRGILVALVKNARRNGGME
jgi:phage gp16-like protein